LSQRSLYPDVTYGFDSGGDPKHIPELTYKQFKAFHERHYHPSNAKLFFYGDDDPDERLRLLDEWLGKFDRITVDVGVPLQPRFASPKRLTRSYPAGQAHGKAGGPAKSTMLTVNWMLEEAPHVEMALALRILEHILIGTPASPLHKALIDSGLGEALAGVGLDEELRQPMFSVGLKGVQAADADKIVHLIEETIRALAIEGIEPLTVEAALNTVEFQLRESNTGTFPRGISFMLRALRSWLHGGDPVSELAFNDPLAAVKTKVADGGRYFERLLKHQFVDNHHRTVLVLNPDWELAEREAREERARLETARARMTARDLQEVVDDTDKLKRMQQRPDPPEALATIPTLKLSDLPRANKVTPCEVTSVSDTRLLYHDLSTNGIVYFDVGFDLHPLSPDLLPYVPLFGRALLETGAGNDDFVRLSQRIGRSTGGIRPQRWTSTIAGSAACTAWLNLRSKALPDQTGELLSILRDVLGRARLDDRARFQQLVLEQKASLESRLVPAGSSYVDKRLRANFFESDWAEEQMGGVSHLFFLRKLANDVETNWEEVLAKLEGIRSTLVDRGSMLCNVTAEVAHWAKLRPQLADFLAELPRRAVKVAQWRIADGPSSEGLFIPAKVNYVGKGANLYREGIQPNGSHLVARRYLRTTWLWDKIRVQGGAYGGQCMFDRYSGGFTFVSYRDPNLIATLDTYDRTADFLRNTDLSQAELIRNIIGTIGEIDSYRLPDAKGFVSMQRYLIGETEESRQRIREEVLSTTIADLRSFADAMAAVAADGRVVVLGSEQAIEAANAERPGLLTVSRVL
jgi:Zn-dependent M16 (insulinase) family peptidase